MNILEGAGALGIATRLQRLSEQFRKDGALIYQAMGIDFEPKWFGIVYTLYIKPGLSVVELSSEIGLTHPSTIALLKELEHEKLIISGKHHSDERKRLMTLSDKGMTLVEKMLPVWAIITKVVEELTDTNNNLTKAISEVEEKMQEQSFYYRARKHIGQAKT